MLEEFPPHRVFFSLGRAFFLRVRRRGMEAGVARAPGSSGIYSSG